MVQPVIVPDGFQNDRRDYLNVKVDRSGAVRQASGNVTVPNGQGAGSIVGLVPFNKGARFVLSDKSVHAATNGTQNLGVVYASTSQGADALTLFASASASGFVVIDEHTGVDYITTGNGWLVIQNVSASNADHVVKFNVGVVYDQPTN